MSSVVVTLFEGDYHLGAASLINSLDKAGFSGRVVIGIRGPLPPWACCTSATDRIELTFVQVHASTHFTNHKPAFLQQLIEGDFSDADAIFYFDPDIVLKADWSFFEEWVTYGVCLVSDSVLNPMPPTHPYRFRWKRWAADCGLQADRELHSYINAGFVGFGREEYAALEDWRRLIEILPSMNVSLQSLSSGHRTSIAPFPDQDALNTLAMCSKHRISLMGPDGMDFVGGGVIMSHATGGNVVKPWRKNFILSALKGIPPTQADRGWLAHSDGPLPGITPLRKRQLQTQLKIAAAIGRFIRRS